MMPTIEQKQEEKGAPHKPKTTYMRDALARVKVRDGKPFEFTPIKIKGESLSETIVRERRGEF